MCVSRLNKNLRKELSFCYKLKFYNPYFQSFQSAMVNIFDISNLDYFTNFKYIESTILGWKI